MVGGDDVGGDGLAMEERRWCRRWMRMATMGERSVRRSGNGSPARRGGASSDDWRALQAGRGGMDAMRDGRKSGGGTRGWRAARACARARGSMLDAWWAWWASGRGAGAAAGRRARKTRRRTSAQRRSGRAADGLRTGCGRAAVSAARGRRRGGGARSRRASRACPPSLGARGTAAQACTRKCKRFRNLPHELYPRV